MLIEASRWTEYFAELSRRAEGYDTAIEIMSSSWGTRSRCGGRRCAT